MNQPSAQIDIQQELTDKLTVYKSLDQEVMITTVDKVKICLMENAECLKAKHEWIVPLSLLITIIATLLATDFKTFLVSAAVWEAIFIIGALICIIWLIKSGNSAWKVRESGGIEFIIEQLKKSSPARTPNNDPPLENGGEDD